MAPAALHPSDDTLADYGLGKLDDPAAADVARHLEACPACRGRVGQLPADSFLGKLRDAVGPRADTSRPDSSVPDGPPPPVPPAAVPPELAAAAQYAEVRELGRGGMGVVYLARNTLMDRLEVLKVVNRSADRFLREIQAAARLKHPNVVGAYSAQRLGDLLVFAMEYVPGDDLARLLKADGPLPVAHACHYAYQAALGLQHAHENGMVHRDIKPSNLILTRDGKKPVVKILDFGLAKGVSETGIDCSLTAEGAMLGTPDYVAPEQTVDAAKADIRSDIYSLGCTLYHLLAGRPPFIGRSLYELLRAHHEVDPPRLGSLRPEVPNELAAVVARMMAKDPARRYPTPAAAAAALMPFFKPAARGSAAALSTARPAMGKLEPDPKFRASPPPPPPPAAPAPSPPTRGRRRVAVGAIAGLALLGLAIAWGTGAIRVRTPEGTLVLEGLPADAEVLVDGSTVTVTRNGDEATFTLRRGKRYALRARLGDRDLELSEGEVAIGGEPVRVRVVDRPPDPKPIPAAGAGPSPPAPGRDPGSTARDLFAAGTVWRGVRMVDNGQYQGGSGYYELIVDGRDGEEFTGHVFENGPNRNPCAVTGTVRGSTIEWTEVPRFSPKRIAKMRATRDGTTLNVSFTCHDDGRFANDGRGRLVRVPRAGEPRPNDFVPIFDGRSLAGWETHSSQAGGWSLLTDKNGNSFGKLVGSGQNLSHLYTKRDDYVNVHVMARVKVNAEGNSGVFVRAGFGPAGGTDEPDGYEAQISSRADQLKTGGLFRPLAGKARPPIQPAGAGPAANQWFDLDVIADGPTVRVLVDGRETARADGLPAGPGGRVALQVFDRQTQVEFAAIAVKELPARVGGPAAAGPDPAVITRMDRLPAPAVEGAPWRVVGDELVSDPEAQKDGAVLFGDPAWGEYDLRFKVQLADRRAAANEYTTVRLHSNGQRTHRSLEFGGWDNVAKDLYNVIDGRWADRKGGGFVRPGLVLGRWHEVHVRVRKEAVDVTFDGQKIISGSDGRFTSGRLGLSFSKGTNARYRDLEVTDPAGQVLWSGVARLGVATPGASAAGGPTPPSTGTVVPDGYVPLFNGKDLTGWMPGQADSRWSVVDGALVNSKGGTILTEKAYSDFTLKFEFRLTPDTAASVDLWAIPGDTPNWVFLENTRDAMAAITWDGREKGFSVNRLNPRAELRPEGEWNEMTIDLRNCILSVTLNGRQLGRVDIRKHVEDRRQDLAAGDRLRGRIGLNKRWGSGTVSVRNLSVRVP